MNPIGDAQSLWNDPQDLISLWDSLESKWRHERLISELVGPTGYVADLGCGVGRYSTVLSYQKYIGYDSSPQMINQAATRNDLPDVEFACVDILRFVSDYKYDTVISIDVVYHLDNPLEALRTIFKLWKAKRYFFTLLVGKEETLLNSKVVSEKDFTEFEKSLNIKTVHTEEVPGESFSWLVLVLDIENKRVNVL